MRSVEVETAFTWWCDDCGKQNFGLPTRAELTNEEKAEAYRHLHDLEHWEALPEGWSDFELVTLPRSVQCEQCKTRYKTRHPAE